MKPLLLLLAFAASISLARSVSFFELVVEEWEEWKAHHKKNYTSSSDEKFRMKIFMENKARIARHNHLASKNRKSFTMKMNHFGDLLGHEFAAMMNGYNHAEKLARQAGGLHHVAATFIEPANIQVPAKMDWRDKGAVTPVKNQGQCGSCWAFSTTGSLEGQHFRKTGQLTSLSEQNLVDCSTSYGNNGCNGGLMDDAFKYVKENGGIDTEASYPYEGEDDNCRYSAKTKGAWDVGFVDVTAGDEQALKKAVASVGPVSVAIDASSETFQFYSKGVYVDESCSPQNLDHGVLVVGYGTEGGNDYWLVKNSWSTKWGDQGYIKMARNHQNMCGIASSASYPLV